ncbi:leucine-rich repeat receptor-like protein kinase [Vitis vinifera]|uniref:Leucine-rich repeat receptor-like protein kinase n=1 Tax=Vitis vinifera TaxID=29760 RepID=A0A438JVA1_VITVI|nr:leucine-rich repeat receptor-like protein kinase [Vitis vinifera]
MALVQLNRILKKHEVRKNYLKGHRTSQANGPCLYVLHHHGARSPPPLIRQQRTQETHLWRSHACCLPSAAFFFFFLPCLSCPAHQKQALLQFKSSILAITSSLNSSDSQLQSWNSSSSCCRWEEVECNDSTTSVVISLDLIGLFTDLSPQPRVQSTILAPIFHIRSLEWLHISDNNIQGEIPAVGFANLSNLYLSLDGNSLSGEVPEEFGKPHKFAGVVPLGEIGNLLNISTLALSNNRLTGGIPSSMQKLSKLKKLYLQKQLANRRNSILVLDFQGLQDFLSGGNRLIWNNSVTIAPNPRPFRLSLKSCALFGEIPKWISTQTIMNYGSLPPSLFSGASLGVLALSRNNFSGELPINIGDAAFLRILMLSGNNFSGPIPQSLIHVPYLRLLDLSRNRFSGNTFPVFYPEGALAYIDFSSNELSGEVPTTFPKETKFLALGGNKFSGALPWNLSNLSKRERLELQDNKLTGLIPESIVNLSNLRILDVSNNNLTGEIPRESRNLVGMIEAPNLPSSILQKIALDFTERWSSKKCRSLWSSGT